MLLLVLRLKYACCEIGAPMWRRLVYLWVWVFSIHTPLRAVNGIKELWTHRTNLGLVTDVCPRLSFPTSTIAIGGFEGRFASTRALDDFFKSLETTAADGGSIRQRGFSRYVYGIGQKLIPVNDTSLGMWLITGTT